MNTILFKAPFARRMADPVSTFRGCERHFFLCSVEDIPLAVPVDPNPRQQNIDRRIYKKVQKHLLNIDCDPNTFHLKNKGITILADKVEEIAKGEYRVYLGENHGIVDGAHTYKLILANQEEIRNKNKKRLPHQVEINQFVKVEVLTGYPQNLIAEIAGGLNTAVQVQQMSLANLGGEFEWIKEELKEEPYIREIAFREGDEGRFDARDILALLDLFNITEFSGSIKYPTRAYSSKESVLNAYIKNQHPYKRLRPLLKDILYLHDLISYEARDLYNKGGSGRGAALKFVDAVDDNKPEHEFLFIGRTGKYRLYGSALMPILGAFRYMVQSDPITSAVSWRGGFESVIELWQCTAFDLMEITKGTCHELGYNLNAIGKSTNHWRSLYFVVSEEARNLS